MGKVEAQRDDGIRVVEGVRAAAWRNGRGRCWKQGSVGVWRMDAVGEGG